MEAEARIVGVRIVWDTDEEVLKFTAHDPLGLLLVKECAFVNVGEAPIDCWFGESGELRFGPRAFDR